jgi:F-type H+-transporting ATPase subunit gamma
MIESVASLRHKIESAQELESVVRTMKAMSSSNISQYENAVRSLDDYYRTVQLGLAACFQHKTFPGVIPPYQKTAPAIGVIVFGSDQGLVGQFNESMVTFVEGALEKLPEKKIIWAVGERLRSRLSENQKIQPADFILPTSINAVNSLVSNVLNEMEAQREMGNIDHVYLFHHRPQLNSIYTPVSQQLLPLDHSWRENLANLDWPTVNLPEVMPKRLETLRALIREYLFVSLFRACAESLASENASRLAAMQRAEKNIAEQQEDLNRTFHRLRQSRIDEELFDVLSGFEALN